MVVPPASDVGSVTPAETGPDPTAPGPRSASAGFRLGLLVVLVLVLVGSFAVTGYLVATRTSSVEGGLADRVGTVLTGDDAIAAEREQVMEVASQFLLRVNTYGPDDLAEDGTMPGYRESVSELITSSFRADFEQQVGTAEQTVAAADLGRSAEIFGAGVATMDADSATALVAGAFTNTYPGSGRRAGERIEDEPAPFRVRVSLVKTDGEWLVDDFAPVTGGGVSLDPSEAPSGGPTTEPSGEPTDQPGDVPSVSPSVEQTGQPTEGPQ